MEYDRCEDFAELWIKKIKLSLIELCIDSEAFEVGLESFNKV